MTEVIEKTGLIERRIVIGGMCSLRLMCLRSLERRLWLSVWMRAFWRVCTM